MSQFAPSILTLSLLALLPAPTSAEAPASTLQQAAPAVSMEDSRWLPWLGCWEPTDSPDDTAGSELVVCFEPIDEGVRVVTLGDGELLGEERIVADGQPVPAADGGCEGTREARWSDDGHRVFILSDLRCAEGVHRTTRGVFAMADEGREWLEIHGVRAADREQTMAVRAFRTASAATLDRHDVTPAGAGRDLAIRTSRMAASAPLEQDDLVEAVQVLDGEVTAALVAEIGEPFQLDASTLRAHASAGIPAEVIDMMVAVTYPDRFVIDAGQPQAAPARTARSTGGAYPTRRVGYASSRYRCPSWDRYCRSAMYRDLYGYYGAPGYGFGWGYGWGFRGPRYVVQPPGTVRDGGGSVSPDRGYRPARTQVREARPRSSETGPAVNQGLGAILDRMRRGSGSSGASSGGRVDPDSGHSSRGGDGRRARPTRTSGGGGGDG